MTVVGPGPEMRGDMTWALLEQAAVQRIRRWSQRVTLLHVLSRLFTLSASAGLLYQVTEVSGLYFKYETKTAIVQSISGPVTPPHVCLCVRYTDLIHGPKGMRRAATLEERFVYQSRLTIKEIFDLTPAANHSLTWCAYRSNDSMHSLVSTSECYSLFNVSKFYTQDLMCYNVDPLIKTTYLINRVAHSLYFSHMMFAVRFSKAFNAADKIHVIAFYGEYPWISRNYASITTRLADYRKMTFKNNKYYVSFLWNKYLLLPAPFDTNCSRVPIEQSSECKKSCMIDQLIKINKVPSSEFITDPIDLPHVNFYDLNDSSTRAFVLHAEALCSSRCDANPCYTDITSTFMDAHTELEIPDQVITIHSRIPLAPVITVTSSEALSLVEYLVYVGGCCGTWLGISVLSFDPFQPHYYQCLSCVTSSSGDRRRTAAAAGPRLKQWQRTGHWLYGGGYELKKTPSNYK